MVSLKINGETKTLATSPDQPLLWVLRDVLGLTGTKYGCGVGVCGICLVHVDGKPARACMTPLAAVAGRTVTTIEGLPADHPVIRAWIAEQVPQCGYCQPGQVMAAAGLLQRDPSPDEAIIEKTMSGVLCRCGTYPRIRRGIHRAARTQGTPEEVATRAARQGAGLASEPAQADDVFAPNPWVRVHRDGTVTLLIDRSEMGQGVITGLSMLVAEELEVDLDQIRARFAPADTAYANPIIGEQLTGGSTSLRGAWEPLRLAGARAREALISAAAATWTVPRKHCRAERGSVVYVLDGRRLGYGALVDRARSVPIPQHVRLKEPTEFRLIGRSLPRLDIPDMVKGQTVYGIDRRLPGMLVASVARCPFIGGQATGFDATEALQVKGVRCVLKISSGIAAVADNVWTALRGRAALRITWDPGPNAKLSSADIRGRFQQAAQRKGTITRDEGDAERALEHASSILDAVYETPYLAHGCMEPMNCIAKASTRSCDIWTGTQAQTGAQQTAAKAAGLVEAQVRVHTEFLGGGFGRRGESDFVREAVELATLLEEPVQVVWTREDDMRHDFFRPANYARLRAGLDETGAPLAWFQRIVGPSLALDGVSNPYAIPNLREESVHEDPGVPTGAWRSVGASQNAFAIECFVDELAHAAGRDPFSFRHELLAHQPRYQKVLEAAAQKSGWGQPLPTGRHRGIAFYYSFKSAAAEVAEVSVCPKGNIRVHRVVCAIDCGLAVNPDLASAQIEGGIVFGLSAALKGAITIENGQVQQSSFEDYPILTLAETPEIEVHILPSTLPPTGVGEPGVPPIAPAVANAVFAATGRRLRTLPLRLNQPW